MVYKIFEDKKTELKTVRNISALSLTDFNLLIDNNTKKINSEVLIDQMIDKDEMINLLNLQTEVVEAMRKCVKEDRNPKEIYNIIAETKLPLFSLITQTTNNYRIKYKKLQGINDTDEIFMICNSMNIAKALELTKSLPNKVTICSLNISLEEYSHILEKLDLDSYKDNVSIYYQEQNNPISPKSLYEVSNYITNIAEEIKKFNLSPMEQITYTYDMVKNRVYKENEEDKKNSRDLDKIIKSDSIVCVGYSNLFNAILKCLNIDAAPLISIEKKHQLSIVYVKDSKYNINGVYLFDPTADRRKSLDSNEYINDYRYFAIPMNLTGKHFPNKLSKVLDLSLGEIIEKISDISKSKESIELLEALNRICDFVHIDNSSVFEEIKFEELADIKVSHLEPMHSDIIKNYNPEEITVEKFIQILYNTRRIEYFNDKVEEISISKIKSAALTRAFKSKQWGLSQNNEDTFERMLNEMIEESLISKKLDKKIAVLIEDSLKDNQKLSRDKENIKLAKVLKKVEEKRTRE